MNKSYKELLHDITTLAFDVDGVFTDNRVQVMPDGELIRTLNARDGYAIQLAAKRGYHIIVITGGRSQAVKNALLRLGVSEVYLGSSHKLTVLEQFMEERKVKAEELLYMGDDIPDLGVLRKAAVAACPSDAAEEVKAMSHYVSSRRGGDGCVREIIEQVMKLRGHWMQEDAFEW